MSDDRERKEGKLAIAVNNNGQLNDNNKEILKLELAKSKPNPEIINQCLKGAEKLDFDLRDDPVFPEKKIDVLIRCLATCTTLRSFALRGMTITLERASLLAQELPKCQLLETLDLSNTLFSHRNASKFASMLPEFRHLHTLNISNVSKSILTAFVAVLPKCPTLRKLSIKNTNIIIHENIGALGKALLRSGVTDLDIIDDHTSFETLENIIFLLQFNGTLVNLGNFSIDTEPLFDWITGESKLKQTIIDGSTRNQNLLNSDAIKKVVKKHLQDILPPDLLPPDLASLVKDYLENTDITAPEFLNFLVTTDVLAKIIKCKLSPTDRLNHYHAIFSTKNKALNHVVDVESFLNKADSIKKTDKIADKIILKVYQSGIEEFTLDIAITPTQVYILAEKMRQYPSLVFKKGERDGVWKPAEVQQTQTTSPTIVRSSNLPLSLSAKEKPSVKDRKEKKNSPPSARTPTSAPVSSSSLFGPGSSGMFGSSSLSVASPPLPSPSSKLGNDEAEPIVDPKNWRVTNG